MLLDPRKICFGEFEMDLKSALLVRGGTPVGLTGQPFRILRLLASRAGEVVTRDEMRAEIWGDSCNVEYEAAINVAIRKIRDVLGESADTPVFLHTVRGRGYRFELGRPPEPVSEVSPAVLDPPLPAIADALPPAPPPPRSGKPTRYIAYLVAVWPSALSPWPSLRVLDA